MQHAAEVYEVASLFNEAAELFTRLATRQQVIEAPEAQILEHLRVTCRGMRPCGKGLTVAPPRKARAARVAATLVEVVKPSYHPELLDADLQRVEKACSTILARHPNTGDVLLHPAQWSWVAEFLSTSCHALFRAIATRSLVEQKTAYGR
ncbi:MAG: hypothetical protein VKN33_09470 [Candidatus Sericytochromatia bacterium]|nr:hypothetical protein [Candidatus Sericytochromatia bacterium]